MRLLVALFTVLLYTGAHEICGQTTSPVNGSVVDIASGQALAGAMITAEPGRITVVADKNGEFNLDLSPGSYVLTAQFLGYATFKIQIIIPL